MYPDERTYPNPYDGRRPNPSGAPAVTVSLPEKPGEWHGCLDQRSTEGDDPPAFSSTLPSDAPFSMNFYTSHTFYPEDYDVSFACAWDGPGDHRRWNWCYDQSAVPESARSDPSWDLKDPQQACDGESPSVIRPLDSDLESVKSAIRALGPGGPATYSTLGVAWATRLLDPAWRDLWGDAVHPMESTDGGQAVQKILVLLSDGDDNHHDRDVTDRHRQQACTAAKAAGIRIFTIAAMNESHRDHGHLARELERCSSQGRRPGRRLRVRQQRDAGGSGGGVPRHRRAVAGDAARLLDRERDVKHCTHGQTRGGAGSGARCGRRASRFVPLPGSEPAALDASERGLPEIGGMRPPAGGRYVRDGGMSAARSRSFANGDRPGTHLPAPVRALHTDRGTQVDKELLTSAHFAGTSPTLHREEYFDEDEACFAALPPFSEGQ